MSTVVVAGVWIAVWVAVSLLVAVLLGGVVAMRDRQVPRLDGAGTGPAVPGPRRAPGPLTGGADPRAPVPGH